MGCQTFPVILTSGCGPFLVSCTGWHCLLLSAPHNCCMPHQSTWALWPTVAVAVYLRVSLYRQVGLVLELPLWHQLTELLTSPCHFLASIIPCLLPKIPFLAHGPSMSSWHHILCPHVLPSFTTGLVCLNSLMDVQVNSSFFLVFASLESFA